MTAKEFMVQYALRHKVLPDQMLIDGLLKNECFDEEEQAEPDVNPYRDEFLCTKISSIPGVSKMSSNSLENGGIIMIGQIVTHNLRELRRFRYVGNKSLSAISDYLERYGLYFGMNNRAIDIWVKHPEGKEL